MSKWNHRQQYVNLMQQFLVGQLDVQQFETAYMNLWKADRDEDWAIFDARYRDKIVTSEDFATYLHQDVGGQSPTEQAFHRITDSVFTGLDLYDPNPTDYWEIDEAELRREIVEAVRKIEELDFS